MTSPARSFIVPAESRDGPSREVREALLFEFRLTMPLGFSVGEIGVVVVILESGEGRDGDERGLVEEEVVVVVVIVFGLIAKEEEEGGSAEAVMVEEEEEEEEELVLVCRFRG